MAADAREHPDGAERSATGLLQRALRGINIGQLLLIIFALHLFALLLSSDTSNGGGLDFDEFLRSRAGPPRYASTSTGPSPV